LNVKPQGVVMKKVTFQNATAWSIRSAMLLLALWSMPTTAGGQIYVANIWTDNPNIGGAIGKYNATTGATINDALVSGLSPYPQGIAVSGGNLFVTITGTRTNGIYNPGSGSIGVYNATTGATVNAALVTGLDGPLDIAVFGGNLLVLNNGSGSIGEYNATTGATVNAALVTGLNSLGFAVSGGNLFVVNNGTIGVYNATTGATVNDNLLSPPFTRNPWGIAVATNPLPGDYDESGTVGQEDYLVWRANFGSTTTLAADGNGDGIINAADYVLWRNIFQATAAMSGDYNQNGTVDAADYVVWRNGLGTTYTQAHYDTWRSNFGATSPGIAAASGATGSASVAPPAPEPTTLVLAVLAFAPLVRRLRGRAPRQD
jgi:hypothetical protein